MIFDIVTYNILADDLCSPEHFYESDPKDLKPKTRLLRLKKRLKKFMPAIICLQELSMTQIHELIPWFHQHGYTGVYRNKIGRNEPLDGIGIFYPIRYYKSITYHSYQIGSLSPKVLKDRSRRHVSRDSRDTWSEVTHKPHVAIYLVLQDIKTKKKFCVVTTHLYANPKYENVKQALLYLFLKHLNKWIKIHKNIPTIVCGDFNMTPDSDMYDYITRGKMLKKIKKKADKPRLKSVYATFEGDEPEFTAHSKTKLHDIFTDTLDYIWITPKIKIKEVKRLPQIDYMESFLPNEFEPSDHIPLKATLII